MKRFEVTLTGESPLLMHANDFEFEDVLSEWLSKPDNKDHTKAGDDRTPPWAFMGRFYTDGEGRITMPSANLLPCLVKAGAAKKIKGALSFKTAMAAAVIYEGEFNTFLVSGREVAVADLPQPMTDDVLFVDYCQAARDLGFSLDVRAVVNPATKKRNIRVRPRFDDWEVVVRLTVTDTELVKVKVFREIWEYAGSMVGLCDWRPGNRSPNSFGKFSVDVKAVK